MKLLLIALLLLSLTAGPVAAQEHSSLDLGFRLLSQEKADKNVALSPFSLQSAFAMAATGARGPTQGEMLKSLGLRPDYLARCKSDLSKLRQDGAEIAIANRLWPSQNLQLKPEFVQACQTSFGAKPMPLDFNAPEKARKAINDWVSEITKTNIPDLIPSGLITPATSLVLTNALYFQGAWRSPFKSQMTKSHPFQGPKGTINVSMMQQTSALPYFETNEFQAVQLGYARSNVAMTIILPKKPDGWRQLRKTFDAKALKGFESEAAQTALINNETVSLMLPRFNLRYRLSVVPAMQALGMNLAFGSQADFSGMTSGGGLFISEAVHEAMVEVDEAGTVGAAATAVIVTRSMPRPGVTMVVDHPFLFVISDLSTNTTLFIGQVLDPEHAKS